MIDVEVEVNKHKTCKDRDKLDRIIKEYKHSALEHATNFTLAGRYNQVALKLQEFLDRLPAPKLKNTVSSTQTKHIKTASITGDENSRINDAWKQRTGR